MKRFMKGLTVLMSLLLLFSCQDRSSGGAPTDGQLFKLTATVRALGEKLEVDVTEGEYASGIYWVIVSDDAVITDKDGNKLSAESIEVGSTVEIEYNGQVMMSLPPQIVARKITIK